MSRATKDTTRGRMAAEEEEVECDWTLGAVTFDDACAAWTGKSERRRGCEVGKDPNRLSFVLTVAGHSSRKICREEK